MPTATVSAAQVEDGLRVIDLLVAGSLVKSLGEGRRVISQGAVQVNGEKVADPEAKVAAADFDGDGLIVKKGKKGFYRFVLEA